MNCHVRVIPVAPLDLFPPQKLFPWKNCIREGARSAWNPEKRLAPTPIYNSTLRSESTLESFKKLLSSTMRKSSAFGDACLLVNIWLRQRGFSTGLSEGGFGSFEASVVMALLLSDKGQDNTALLSDGHTSYQLFRALLHFLASKDLINHPTIDFLELSDENVPNSNSPMLFDGARGLNVLFKMTPWSYQRVRIFDIAVPKVYIDFSIAPA